MDKDVAWEIQKKKKIELTPMKESMETQLLIILNIHVE